LENKNKNMKITKTEIENILALLKTGTWDNMGVSKSLALVDTVINLETLLKKADLPEETLPLEKVEKSTEEKA
jgi:hypothetical protein